MLRQDPKRRNFRVASGVVSTVLFTAGLAGCENAYHFGPYELSYDGTNLVVVSCEERDVETIYLEERGTAPGNEGRVEIWEAAGKVSLAKGDVLVVGGENPGLRNKVSVAPKVEPGMRYFVGMNEVQGSVDTALFTIPPDGLPEGRWLSPHGDLASEPCQSQ